LYNHAIVFTGRSTLSLLQVREKQEKGLDNTRFHDIMYICFSMRTGPGIAGKNERSTSNVACKNKAGFLLEVRRLMLSAHFFNPQSEF
jgi:hypothetical protein